MSDTITFSTLLTHLDREIEVEVSATVSWSSGLDAAGYQSGYIVEDLTAKWGVHTLPLLPADKERLKVEALTRYLA